MSKSLQNQEFYEFNPFRVDVSKRVLTKDQEIIPLTPKAFDTLVVLLRNKGDVVEKDKLLQAVWPETFVEEGILAVNVAAIRKVLRDGDEGRSYIETVPRRGYRFIGEVQTVQTLPEERVASSESERPSYSNRSGTQEVWKVSAEGDKMLQVTTGGGHESFESPDGKMLFYEDNGGKGLQIIPTESSEAQQGTVVLRSVRPGYWAVAEKGIYFVEFDKRADDASRLGSRFWIRSPDDSSNVSQLIKFYDFRTRKVIQIGTIERRVLANVPGFSVTSDGRSIAWSQIDHAESDLMMIENFR